MQALSRNQTRHGRTVIVALVGMAIALAVALAPNSAAAAPIAAERPGPRLHPGVAPPHQIPRVGRQAALALEADEADGDVLQAVEPAALPLPDRIAERLRPPLGGRAERVRTFPRYPRLTANAP